MQSIYALHQKNSDDIEKEEKFLLHSIDSIQDLYLIMLSSMIEIRKKEIVFLEASSNKHLATPEEKNPNRKFVSNAVLNLLEQSNSLNIAIEKRKITNWTMNDDYILILLNEIKQSELYQKYMMNKKSSFEEDKDFVIEMFSELIAPNEKLYEYLEDYKLTWVDDIPVVNTQILKQLKQVSAKEEFRAIKLYKDQEDKEFVSLLFNKTVLNEIELAKEYIDDMMEQGVDVLALENPDFDLDYEQYRESLKVMNLSLIHI